MNIIWEIRKPHLGGQVAQGLLATHGWIVLNSDGNKAQVTVTGLITMGLPQLEEGWELFNTGREARAGLSVGTHGDGLPDECLFAKPKQYGQRDIIELDKKGGYYSRHVEAMTREELYGKGQIAAELAYRDEQIVRLQKCLSEVMDVATGETQVGDEDAEDEEQVALEYIAERINEAGYELWRIETDEEEE